MEKKRNQKTQKKTEQPAKSQDYCRVIVGMHNTYVPEMLRAKECKEIKLLARGPAAIRKAFYDIDTLKVEVRSIEIVRGTAPVDIVITVSPPILGTQIPNIEVK